MCFREEREFCSGRLEVLPKHYSRKTLLKLLAHKPSMSRDIDPSIDPIARTRFCRRNRANTGARTIGGSGGAAGYNGRVLPTSRAIRLETISDIHLLRGFTPRSRRKRKGTEGSQTRRVSCAYERITRGAARCCCWLANRGREIPG